jgi:hypothetical protein
VTIPGTQVQAPGWYPDPVGQARFRHWDGKSWTAETSNAKDPDSGGVLGPGFAHLADWLGRCLVLVAIAALAVAAVIGWAGALLGPYSSSLPSLFQPDSASLTPELKSDLTTVWGAFLIAVSVYGLISLATGILWWIWQYQLASAAPAPLRRGPGMHLASWIIPIVNWWWPFQNMADLWAAYGTGRPRADDVASGIGVWWGAYVGLPFVGGMFSFALMVSATPSNLVSRLAMSYALTFVLVAVSAALARGVVTRLSWRALEHWATTQ